MGQIVSCRKGLLGEEWVNSLAKLQDRVPARSGQDALDLAYSAFEGGEEEFHRIFTDFDSSPLAAASLGQVVSFLCVIMCCCNESKQNAIKFKFKFKIQKDLFYSISLTLVV